MGYSLRDNIHFVRMWQRSQRRQRLWGKAFEQAIRDETYQLPFAAVVQIIPTESCNLRCSMCNQWGDNGYFRTGVRPVNHMDLAALTRLLEALDPVKSYISIHGGEPFAYKHIGALLRVLAGGAFDVMFSTNGTLLDRCLDELSEVENLSLLLSIDGDETTHDQIRGRGNFQKAVQGLEALRALRRKKRIPAPMVVMSYTVCEGNAHAAHEAYAVAKRLNAYVLNCNMRWFLTERVGIAYEKHLQESFGVRSSGAWRGWISNEPDCDYGAAADTVANLVEKSRRALRPPFVMTTPNKLRGDDFRTYFSDFTQTFGNESCFMPFYWARIHANGELIFCPGHPDLIAGNALTEGFDAAFNSKRAVEFRRHILTNRFPICNRCCGLYMANVARPLEQKARRRLGLARSVRSSLPTLP